MDKDKQIKKILSYSIEDLKESELLKRGLSDLGSIENEVKKNRILFRRLAVEAMEDGQSSELKLSKIILESAFECLEKIKSSEKIKDDRATQIIVLSEFLYFFLHNTARMVDIVDRNNRSKLMGGIGLWTIYAVVETVWETVPENQKDEIIEKEFENLNDREQTYSKCKELFSKHDDTKSLKENLIRSEGLVNQLILQLGYVVLGRLIENSKEDSLFIKKIGDAVMDSLTKNKEDMQVLIPKALLEISESHNT